MSKQKVAIYAGTFDPITVGHLDVIKRAATVFPSLIVAVAENPAKSTLFTADERKDLVLKSLDSDISNVSVETFSGLLVNYVKKKNASIIVRGLRAVADYDYEAQIALTNRKLAPELETVFFLTSDNYSFISASIVKSVAENGGELSGLVPPVVAEALQTKYQD